MKKSITKRINVLDKLIVLMIFLLVLLMLFTIKSLAQEAARKTNFRLDTVSMGDRQVKNLANGKIFKEMKKRQLLRQDSSQFEIEKIRNPIGFGRDENSSLP